MMCVLFSCVVEMYVNLGIYLKFINWASYQFYYTCLFVDNVLWLYHSKLI